MTNAEMIANFMENNEVTKCDDALGDTRDHLAKHKEAFEDRFTHTLKELFDDCVVSFQGREWV